MNFVGDLSCAIEAKAFHDVLTESLFIFNVFLAKPDPELKHLSFKLEA